MEVESTLHLPRIIDNLTGVKLDIRRNPDTVLESSGSHLIRRSISTNSKIQSPPKTGMSFFAVKTCTPIRSEDKIDLMSMIRQNYTPGYVSVINHRGRKVMSNIGQLDHTVQEFHALANVYQTEGTSIRQRKQRVHNSLQREYSFCKESVPKRQKLFNFERSLFPLDTPKKPQNYFKDEPRKTLLKSKNSARDVLTFRTEDMICKSALSLLDSVRNSAKGDRDSLLSLKGIY